MEYAPLTDFYPIWCIWGIVIVAGMYLLAFVFRLFSGGTSAKEERRVQALNEYAAALQKVQDASYKGGLAYIEAKEAEKKAHDKLMSLGGFTSL